MDQTPNRKKREAIALASLASPEKHSRRSLPVTAETVPEVRKRYPKSSGAPLSAQTHGLIARNEIVEWVREEMSRGYDLVLDPLDKLIDVRLRRPLHASNVSKLLNEVFRRHGRSRPTEAAGEKGPAQSFSLLATTSKMGCYSFNLLAGPTSHWGACPASGIGLHLISEGEREKTQRSLISQINPEDIDPEQFICGGCYALKGRYVSPMIMLKMTVIQLATFDLLEQGTFAEWMVKAIGYAREKSRKALSSKRFPAEKRYTIPHPDYFRIHDAGDFFRPDYWDAWHDVMTALPDVNFWAPTRMWAMRGGVSERWRGASPVPENLALRPSALHFKDLSPSGPLGKPATGTESDGTQRSGYSVNIPGMAAGSGAAASDAMPRGVWVCPAYKLETEGGGAVPNTSKRGHETKEGTCARATGITKAEAPSAKGGAGCRACWIHKSTPIYYEEH